MDQNEKLFSVSKSGNETIRNGPFVQIRCNFLIDLDLEILIFIGCGG